MKGKPEKNGLVWTEMRCTQLDRISLVKFCTEPQSGIGFIKNLDIIGISFGLYNMIIPQ